MRDHTKLKAFNLEDEIAVLVYEVTRSYPGEELSYILYLKPIT